MAQLKKGILGGVSGKVGNVVGGSWKGIDYVRSLPSGGHNANTQNQIAQRQRFSVVIKFLQPIKEFVRIGFKGLAVKKSAFNAAMSYNYHNALSGEYPDINIDYTKASVSRGSLAAAVNPVCSSAEAAKVTVSWEANTGQVNAFDGDIASIVVYNPTLGQAVYSLDGGTRIDGSSTLNLPVNYSGSEVHCYISFMQLENGLIGNSKDFISNSVYVGSVSVM